MIMANVLLVRPDSDMKITSIPMGVMYIASYLEKQGVDASRMTITDGSDSKPVGDIKTSAGRKLNRRVEIDLTVR